MLLEPGQVFPPGSSRSFAPIHEYAAFGCEGRLAQPLWLFARQRQGLSCAFLKDTLCWRLLLGCLVFFQGYQPRPALSLSCHPGYLFAAPVLLVLV
jgi:hypothetical protein